MPHPIGTIQNLKGDVARCRELTRERHRRGEDPFEVVACLTDGVDAILRRLVAQELAGAGESLALVAVGGYGRRELCPFSDIDLLFLRESAAADKAIQRFLTLLWDGGFDLGHSVRTLGECYRFMADDVVTAATLMEHRFVAGSSRLYARFQATVISRYRRRWREPFARLKLEQLRRSLEAPDRTIYVLEPHLKDGLGGLRDIQRVLWIENMRRGAGTFEAFKKAGVFAPQRIEALREAYGFILRVRCENHFTHGLKQDIIEADSLPDIARHLGYRGPARDAAEGLMADYYRHTRNTVRFLRYYVETGTQGRKFLGRLTRKLFATHIKPHLLLYQGALYLGDEPQVDDLAAGIMDIFLEAHRRDVRLSEALSEWIRLKLADGSLDFARSSVVHRALLSILREGRNAGRILKTMHKTGVLQRVIPEFGRLEGLVQFDGHHHFTVDEHTLRTLEKLDAVELAVGGASGAGEDGRGRAEEVEFSRVLEGIPDRLPLRLALLLHDLGKAAPGDHSVSGSEATILICERLGVNESITATVEFLVYRHLQMFKISEKQEFKEDGVIEAFARLVGSEERLKMLYLLTYIDISSVGPGIWTAWKGAQLAELYQRTLLCLRTGTVPEEDFEETLRASELTEPQREAIKAHCAQVNTPGYVREIVPERMLFHVEMVDRFRSTGVTQVEHSSFVGYHEITFCCRDRPRLFADLTGILLSEGFNVLGARIFSRDDGIALDIFQVEVADDVRIGAEVRVQRVRQKLRDVESRKRAVADLIRQWLRANRYTRLRRAPRPLYGPAVTFDNEASERSTVVEVNAGDRPGLLHDLASALSGLGLDVRAAKVSTIGTRARDTFYVVEADGFKVTNPARRKLIETELIERARRPAPALVQGGLLYRDGER